MKLKREIGSEFHIEPCNSEFANSTVNNVIDYLAEFNTVYFDSGRSALRAVLQGIPQKRVLLPNYICESVRACFINSEVTYYNINDDLHIDWDDLLNQSKDNIDILYLHFFNGYIGTNYDFDRLASLREQYGFVIIEDTTHSFLGNKRVIGDYCVCSLRKWFPISDGGALYSHLPLVSDYKNRCVWAEQKRSAMEDKYRYLMGSNEDKSGFLSTFVETEKQLDEQGKPYCISEEAYNTLRRMDIELIRTGRIRNQLHLKNKLCDIGYNVLVSDGMKQVPMFCVLKLPNRDSLRKFLIDNCIYCPIHWPLYDELRVFSTSVINQSMELSIPIDQRYTEQDMDYIAEYIQRYNQRSFERE